MLGKRPNSLLLLRQPITALLLACVLATLGSSSNCAADEAGTRDWELRPYKVRVVVAVRTASVGSEPLAAAVAKHLVERTERAIGPMWDLEIQTAVGQDFATIGRLTKQLPSLKPDAPSLTSYATGFDKLLLLMVEEKLTGFVTSGVEYDVYLQRPGSPQEVNVALASELPEQCFSLAASLFSPVASFQLDPKNSEQVLLTFRGESLPSRGAPPRWHQAGDIMVPLLRRTDNEGLVPEGGIQEAAWTFLQMLEEKSADGQPLAAITSHTRRPFSARRRGRVEQLAVRVPIADSPTVLKLVTRGDTPEPLAGYQVFEKRDGEKKLTPLGNSDREGRLPIPHGDQAIRLLYVKSGSKLVAKLPIPPGIAAELTAPLLDERARIDAEARLGQFREELIDLVARRSILAARVRDQIKKNDLDQARKLLEELNNLAGRALLNQQLSEQEVLARSSDPQVQRRINSLFEDTRGVLGAFLGTKDVRELNQELAEATKSASK